MRYSLSPVEIFVDHQSVRRSGHMGHAMVEYKPGCILTMNSNVDPDRVDGHSGYGWMEIRRSLDGGTTWSEAEIAAPSKQVFDAGRHSALCEKMVCLDDGSIVAFWAITDASLPICSEPWVEPMLCISRDEGLTWDELRTFGPDKGRIYDAVIRNGVIYVFTLANDGVVSFLGNKPEHQFKLWVSCDHAQTFHLQSVLPVNATGMAYGALEFDEAGRLHAYMYQSLKEEELLLLISGDLGKTWSDPIGTVTAGKIRNPQVVRVGNQWFLHGRNGGTGDGLILYASDDGIHWDEGTIIVRRPAGGGIGYYSNNLPVSRFDPEGPKRIRVQFSHVYEKNRVNIAQFWIHLQPDADC